ncbi:MAG: hypothetical protein J7M14_02695 [Planctomycetes bacterium]|nr:hypothetical protein [Planctomycetota bacterium]
MPLFLASDSPMLAALLKEFPKLLVIATKIGVWGSDRLFCPFARQF